MDEIQAAAVKDELKKFKVLHKEFQECNDCSYMVVIAFRIGKFYSDCFRRLYNLKISDDICQKFVRIYYKLLDLVEHKVFRLYNED